MLLVGQAPPPYGGQAVMIEQALRGRYDNTELFFVRMAFAREFRGAGRPSLRKALHLVALVARIAVARLRRRTTVLYFPPSGAERLPMYRDLVLLLCIRWMFAATIFHFHAGGVSELYPELRPWVRALFRRAFFHPDVAIRTSKAAPEDGLALLAAREFVIPNGVEDTAARAPEEWFAERDAGDPRILFVGLLRESKGVFVLLDACRELRTRGVPFRLELMGEFHSATIEDRVRAAIGEAHLAGTVTWLGALAGEDKDRAYARASVLAYPTFFESETFGLVLVEAMQFGLPVVASAWRGVTTVVEEGVNGHLVPARDSQALADRLETLLRDPAMRRRLGDAGRRRYESCYTLGRFHHELGTVFAALQAEGVG